MSYATAVNIEVFPRFSDNTRKEYKEASGEKFMRVGIDGSFKFVGVDYSRIFNSVFKTKFTIDIYKHNSLYFQGYFYYNDCNVDQDKRVIEVKLTPNDDYTEIIESYSNQLPISDFNIAKDKFFYKRYPLVQCYCTTYYGGNDYVTNIQGGMTWEQSCTPFKLEEFSVSDFEYHTRQESFCYLDSTYQIGGQYNRVIKGEDENDDLYIKTDGLYLMERKSNPSAAAQKRWEIRDTATNTVSWVSEYVTSGEKLYSLTANTFTNVSYGYEVVFNEEKWLFFRTLCDNEMFADVPGVTVYDNPQDFCENEQYTKIVQFPDLTDEIEINVGFNTQITPNEYNKSSNGKYFVRPESLNEYKYIPTAEGFWGEQRTYENVTLEGYLSYWLRFSDNYINKNHEYSTQLYSYGYKITDVINAFLEYFNINRKVSSQFLTASTNPITGIANKELIITDVSNVSGIDPRNNKLSTNDETSLAEILELLKTQNLYWDFYGNVMRIEHTYFYDNGQSYTSTPLVNIDLTNLIGTRNKKAWSYGIDNYDFEVDNYRYTRLNSNDVTKTFGSSLIEVDVRNEKENKFEMTNFVMDIDYINAMSQDFRSGNGFFMCLCDKTSDFEIKVSMSDKYSRAWVQNCEASMSIIAKKYMAFNFDANTCDIDGEEIDVDGFFRPKMQKAIYVMKPQQEDPDTTKLVETNQGSGYIDKNIVYLDGNYCEIYLKHER